MGLFWTEAEGYSSLQEAGVRLVPHEVCRRPDVFGNHVTADMICAGLSGCADACQVGRPPHSPLTGRPCVYRPLPLVCVSSRVVSVTI